MIPSIFLCAIGYLYICYGEIAIHILAHVLIGWFTISSIAKVFIYSGCMYCVKDNILSRFVDCLFYSLMILCVTYSFYLFVCLLACLMRFNLFIYLGLLVLLVLPLKSGRFTSVFFSEFIILANMFRSLPILVHFLCMVWDMSGASFL